MRLTDLIKIFSNIMFIPDGRVPGERTAVDGWGPPCHVRLRSPCHWRRRISTPRARPTGGWGSGGGRGRSSPYTG